MIQKLTDKRPTTGWISCDAAMPSPLIRVLVRWPHLEGHGYSYGLGGWTGQGKKFLFDDGIYIVESVTQWMEIPE